MKLWGAIKKCFFLPEPESEAQARSRISATPCGRVHDFTERGWGHNISKCGDSMAAWSTPRLQDYDRIITERGRFIVFDVEPTYDPPDMVFFNCIKDEAGCRSLERLI